MAHIHEKIDFTATAVIVCGDKVLLRHHEKYNLRLSPGGHIELDEDPAEAILREVLEETGLTVKLIPPPQHIAFEDQHSRNIIPPFFINRHNVNPTHEHIDMVYLAKSTSMELNPAPDEKPAKMVWLTKEDIDAKEDIEPWMRRITLFALETVK